MSTSEIVILIVAIIGAINGSIALVIAIQANKIAKQANLIASRPLDEYYKEMKEANARKYAENSLRMEQKNILSEILTEMKAANERLYK